MKFYRCFMLAVTLTSWLATTALAQSRNVSGSIKDPNGNAMPGVTVQVKGTSTGTVSDGDGKYSMSVEGDNSVLVFSFIGFANQEVQVGTQSSIDVVLNEDAKQLQEVVVVGYGEQKKINLTGAVSSIDTKALDSRPIADVSRGLQGTAPGMNIVIPSGELGSEPTIRIRGQIASLNGGSSPLILLDNVEIPSLLLVNQQDIQSISILKDAASTSIYGAKGAFGVILITSKKGAKKEGVTVSYQGNLSFSNISRKMEMAGIDGMEYTLLAGQRIGRGTPATPIGAFWYVTQEGFDKAKAWQQNWGGIVKPGDPMLYGRDWYIDSNGNKIGLRMYDPYEAMVRAWTPTQIHTLSISGMSGKTNYNVGVGYTDQTGINKPAKKDQFQRYNASVQLNTEVNKWLKFNYGTIYSKRIKSYPFVTAPANADPWLYLYRWAETYPTGISEDGNDIRSPYSEMKQANTGTQETNYSQINAGFTLTPMKNWMIKFDYTHANEEYIDNRPGTRFTAGDSWSGAVLKKDAAGNQIYVNDAGQVVTSTDPGAIPAYMLNYTTYTAAGSSPDYLYRLAQNSQRNTINLYSTYDLNLSGEHNFKFMVGMNRVGYKLSNNTSQIFSLIDYANAQASLATGTQQAGGFAYWESQLGFFGRVNYTFKDKYLVEANVRQDGSSKFPTNLQWRTFPSFSAGWLVDKEAFMDWSRNYLDQFKIRASWGSIGDQTVSNNLYVPAMNGATSNWIISGSRLYQFGTPAAVSQSIGWQNITTLDIGTDIRVLKNALGLTVDWFQRDTQDMLVPQPGLPATYGTSAPIGNLGSLRTTGIELQLDYTHQFENGLRLNFVGMLSDAVTKITKYGTTTSIDNWYVGKTYGEIWGYETDRLYQKSDFAYDASGNLVPTVVNGVTINQLADGSAPTQEKLQTSAQFLFGPGDVKYKDLNGDGVLSAGARTTDDHGDLKVIGNITPRYEYSFRVGADYKGFDFSIFIQGIGKREIWGDGSLAIPGYNTGDGGMPQAFAGNFWRDDRTNAFYPRPWNIGATAGGNTAGNNMWPQSRYLLDMSYTRIKNITLGYSLSPSIIQKVHLTKARVYVSLENFFTFSNLGNLPIDPENIPGVSIWSGNGATSGSYDSGRIGVGIPTFKSASFGIQLSF